MSDIEFINGLNFKAPNDNAPEYVKAKGSIRREELIAWLQNREGDWVNFDVKIALASGKWYAAVDNWKPTAKGEKPQRKPSKPAADDFLVDSEIPF